MYILIKVCRGTKAPTRFKTASPPDTFVTIWSIRECHVKLIFRLPIYLYIKLMIQMSKFVLSYNDRITEDFLMHLICE